MGQLQISGLVVFQDRSIGILQNLRRIVGDLQVELGYYYKIQDIRQDRYFDQVRSQYCRTYNKKRNVLKKILLTPIDYTHLIGQSLARFGTTFFTVAIDRSEQIPKNHGVLLDFVYRVRGSHRRIELRHRFFVPRCSHRTVRFRDGPKHGP